MNAESVIKIFNELLLTITTIITSTSSYIQLLGILSVYLLAYWISYKIRKSINLTNNLADSANPLWHLAYRISGILYPLLAIVMMRILIGVGESQQYSVWLMNTALVVAVLLFFNSIVVVFVTSSFMSPLFRWIGLPILSLHLFGYLPTIIKTLENIALSIGNFEVSAYGLVRVLIFGGLLFWLGRASNVFGQDIIRKQKTLDARTREVFSKLYEVGLFCIIAILLLNVMGISLTTLAVFGGAVGVGLGLGLQSIASNFISGIIILLDRSLTVGDFVELDDGSKGFVREFRMRYAVLETYDGKDILVPNEKFISSLLINWTHKDSKQRYRVDFSVPYATDIRSMVELIKIAVAEHPQVISGEKTLLEDRPDCEIANFGDSGVNMFVEFWMEGVDDGKNRVGGDLMLIIFETLKANGIEIPFPQREVRILNNQSLSFKKFDEL
jgi:small-conductance mechanosensitive channel